MAFKVGDLDPLKLKALDDPDLEQLWAEIGEIGKEKAQHLLNWNVCGLWILLQIRENSQ